MNVGLQTTLYLATVAAILAVVHVPLGNWIHRALTDPRDWRGERWIYRLVGVDPRVEQSWRTYAVAVVAFAAASIGLLFALIMVQGLLPTSFGRSQHWHTALNTAVSFTTGVELPAGLHGAAAAQARAGAGRPALADHHPRHRLPAARPLTGCAIPREPRRPRPRRSTGAASPSGRRASIVC